MTRGIDLRWLERHTLTISDAPLWYSLRARILGELCGSCDLGLIEFGCQCPPSELIAPIPIRPDWWRAYL